MAAAKPVAEAIRCYAKGETREMWTVRNETGWTAGSPSAMRRSDGLRTTKKQKTSGVAPCRGTQQRGCRRRTRTGAQCKSITGGRARPWSPHDSKVAETLLGSISAQVASHCYHGVAEPTAIDDLQAQLENAQRRQNQSTYRPPNQR